MTIWLLSQSLSQREGFIMIALFSVTIFFVGLVAALATITVMLRCYGGKMVDALRMNSDPSPKTAPSYRAIRSGRAVTHYPRHLTQARQAA
ncbi:MAG: hypothetical protein R3E04_08425 [Sphingobium sp.]